MRDNLKRISVFLKDDEKKEWWVITKEVLQLLWIKKQFPLYYFGRFFYKQGAPSAHNFMNLDEYYSIIRSSKLKRKPTSELLSNKLCFALFCQANSLPAPELLGYNLYNSFSSGKKMHFLKDEEEFFNFCLMVFENHDLERIFVKPSGAKGGRGIFLLTKNLLSKNHKEIWNTMKDGSFIFQRPIIQHEKISVIFPKSINTLRIETYLDKNDQVQILGGFMRFGSGKSYVDNISSGGFVVHIDFKTGILHKKGFLAMINGSKTITNHPDSGQLISGFQIPFFQDSIEICKRFAQYIPNRIIGWDVAITPTGPIIIEGNHDAAIIGGEFSYGGYKNHPVFEELMCEI